MIHNMSSSDNVRILIKHPHQFAIYYTAIYNKVGLSHITPGSTYVYDISSRWEPLFYFAGDANRYFYVVGSWDLWHVPFWIAVAEKIANTPPILRSIGSLTPLWHQIAQ